MGDDKNPLCLRNEKKTNCNNLFYNQEKDEEINDSQNINVSPNVSPHKKSIFTNCNQALDEVINGSLNSNASQSLSVEKKLYDTWIGFLCDNEDYSSFSKHHRKPK